MCCYSHWCMRTAVCCLVLVLCFVCCCSTLKPCQGPCLLHCMWTSAPCLLVIRDMGWARRQQRLAGEQYQSAQSKITDGNLILATRLGRKIAARAEHAEQNRGWSHDADENLTQGESLRRFPPRIITRIRAAACGSRGQRVWGARVGRAWVNWCVWGRAQARSVGRAALAPWGWPGWWLI
jgi:hypothetical protein